MIDQKVTKLALADPIRMQVKYNRRNEIATVSVKQTGMATLRIFGARIDQHVKKTPSLRKEQMKAK